MNEFDAIRPYNDAEVPTVLNRLVNDAELLDSIARLRLPAYLAWCAGVFRPWIRNRIAREITGVNSIHDFQLKMEPYLSSVIGKTVANWTISGLDKLNNDQAYLFVSNHRDIAMDSAFVNYAIYQAGFSTLRIAIGDNLLTKPFASDLMRLNKSFIVNRSATAPREKFKAAKLLSKYIHHSVCIDGENVWIAQREGRAKDGIDVSNSAIMNMFGLSRDKSIGFSEHIRSLNIVPVAISYEYDPCDTDKARELFHKEKHGEYEKDEHEDVGSIAKGITGHKGDIHLSFGEPLRGHYENAEDLTRALDQQIQSNYVLHATNCFAYELLEHQSPKVTIKEDVKLFSQLDLAGERNKFIDRVNACPKDYQQTLLKAYANPVYGRLNNTMDESAKEVAQG